MFSYPFLRQVSMEGKAVMDGVAVRTQPVSEKPEKPEKPKPRNEIITNAVDEDDEESLLEKWLPVIEKVFIECVLLP